ncbi:MAG: DUF2339 domain-containing protein [Acidobacteria bacterium]|nr:DUF2339 domain-containing protein [Acidobacteriota bacterium]
MRPSTPPIAPRATAPAPAAPAPKKFSFDFEEKLGTNWLNKIGITILVLGVAFWLMYKLPTLSNFWKVVLGYAVSFAMLSGGVFFEKTAPRYRVLARTAIGGGWSLVYFTTFAMYFIEAARVLDSRSLALTLLLVVAAAMVGHTLRYDSQLVTGLAFFLGFSTVGLRHFSGSALDHETAYSLASGALLAAGLVAVTLRRRWFELEIFGLLASYLNHYFWLRPIIEPMIGNKQPFPEFFPSAALLVFYWAAFRVSYLLRQPEDDRAEATSAVAALLNTGLLLALLHYQAVQTNLAFWVLLGLGAAELTLGQLPRPRRRRMPFIVLTTMGAAMLVAAPLYEASGSGLSVVWLAEAEALFIVGVLTREIVFRNLGALAALLTAGHLLAVDAWPRFETFLATGAAAPEFRLAILFGAAMLVFYANAHGIGRRHRELFSTDLERGYLVAFSYVAAALAFVGAWLAWPGAWLCVAWGVLALLLAIAGSRLALEHLSIQAHFFGVAAFVWGVTHNLETTASLHGVSVRLLTLGLVAALLYASARWARLPFIDAERSISTLYTWAGSFLVALLAWKELPWAWPAVAWAAFALALLLIGRWLDRNDLRWQAHLVALAALVRALAVNLDAGSDWHGISLRLATLMLVAVLFYASARWASLQFAGEENDLSALYTCAGSLLVALLAWKELPWAWTAVAWAAFALALLLVGRWLDRNDFRWQAHLVALAALARAVMVNLEAIQDWHGVTLRLITLTLIAGLFYLSSLWSGLRELERLWQLPAAYTSAGALLIALLAWTELPAVWTPVAWATFGLLLVVAGRGLKRQELPFQSMFLFVAAFAWALANNFGATENYLGLTLRLITVTMVAVLFYVASRWATDPRMEGTRFVSAAYTWAGSILVALLAWTELPSPWIPVFWAAFAVVLFVVGRGLSRAELPLQAHILAAAAFLRAIAGNFSITQPYLGLTLRLITVSMVATLLYLASRWATEPKTERTGYISAAHAYTWAGSLLVAVLIWYEAQPTSVALGWALFGLVLFELGFARLSTSLRLQAYALFAASFVRLFIANLNAESAPGELSPRLFSVLPLAFAYYYVYARLRNGPKDGFAIERKRDAAGLFNYFGAITVAALMRFELSPDWVVAGWAALVVILFAMAAQSKQTIYLHQGLLLCVAVAFRTAFHNFMLPQYYPPGEWQRPVLTVGTAAALLFCSLPFAFRLRAPSAEPRKEGPWARFWAGLLRRPEQALFFLPLALITVLLVLEVRRGLLTVSWGVEGVLVFLVALWAGERSYRLSGLALLLLCVGKIVFVDAWELTPGDRYLTFIILGAALLLVSYLYTRFKEKLRRYL